MKVTAAIILGLVVAGCDEVYAASPYGSYDAYGAVDSNVTLVAGHADHGPLTAANGMTLYTFDNDSSGTSNCYGDCAVNWPPYEAATGAQPPGDGFSIIERRDGTRQWAKDGAPLYFWVGDAEPGDTNGDGIGGVWRVAH